MYRGAGPGLEPESVPGTGQAANPQEGVLGLFPELGGSTAGVSMRESSRLCVGLTLFSSASRLYLFCLCQKRTSLGSATPSAPFPYDFQTIR